MLPDQNKKGVNWEFSIIGALIILLVGGYAIAEVIRHTASKFDEKFQVELCKNLNQIKLGASEKSSGLLTSGESICYTIAKHRDKKTFVPTENYKQNKDGAEREIRDMIKNCWDMWLQGSKQNMFKDYPFKEPCFPCYTFKIREKVNGVTYSSLINLMNDPLYAKDMGHKCSSKGGYWKPKCDADEEETEPLSKNLQNTNSKCCVKSSIRNECENRGGRCSQGRTSEAYGLYDKWSCPKSGENCYVQKNDVYSHLRYIREFGPRGGDIFFVPPDSFKESNRAGGLREVTDINYIPGEVYAISFVSPTKQICWRGDQDTIAGCAAQIGKYGFFVGAGGAIVAYFGGSIVGAVGTVGWFALKLLGVSGAAAAGAVGGIGYYLGIIDNIVKAGVDKLVSPIESGSKIPNFLIVSTLDDAERLGCNAKYAG